VGCHIKPLRDSNAALSVVEEVMFSIVTKQRVLALLSRRAPPPAVSSPGGLDEIRVIEGTRDGREGVMAMCRGPRATDEQVPPVTMRIRGLIGLYGWSSVKILDQKK
jgi:hypothetical protein